MCITTVNQKQSYTLIQTDYQIIDISTYMETLENILDNQIKDGKKKESTDYSTN